MIWIAFPRGWIELPKTGSAQAAVFLNVEAQLLPVDGCAEKSQLQTSLICWQDTITGERINTSALFVKFCSLGAKLLLFFTCKAGTKHGN